MNRTQFIFTVDVEWDRKAKGSSVSVDNLSCWQGLHDVCLRYAIKPTYLCSYEVLSSPAFNDFIRNNDAQHYEIGAHLHPWTTPPFIDQDDRVFQSFPSELQEHIFREKMTVLTNAFLDCGIKPFSYRAGRFGFDKEIQTNVLLDLGFKVDCSVTPGVDWSQVKGRSVGGPDFRGFSRKPFYIDRKGNMHDTYFDDALLEVPLTIFDKRQTLLWLRPMPQYKRYGLLKYMTLNLSELTRLCAKNLAGEDGVVLQMFMHLNELDAKANPYFTSKYKVQKLIKFLKTFFAFLNSQRIDPVTLKELYATLRSKEPVCA
ncbi:MAG: hypothetical protein JW938_06070 [Candidatus Omnitrophica bacterium]|nr:hypothetical protein [Candidatus Omnitrophota bacterium]